MWNARGQRRVGKMNFSWAFEFSHSYNILKNTHRTFDGSHKILKTQCEMYKKTTMFSWWGTSCHMYHLMDVNPPHGCQSPTRRLFKRFRRPPFEAHFGYFDQLNVAESNKNHRDFLIFESPSRSGFFFVRKCHQHFFGNDRSKHLSKNYNAMVHAHQQKSRNCFSFWLHFFFAERKSLPAGWDPQFVPA